MGKLFQKLKVNEPKELTLCQKVLPNLYFIINLEILLNITLLYFPTMPRFTSFYNIFENITPFSKVK
jgi:hypothetical protein